MAKNDQKKSKSLRDASAKSRFIACLMLGHSVTVSAREAGISRRTLYDWRDSDFSFRSNWDDAIESSADLLEDEVRSRALDRTDKDSARLLVFLLKKLRPAFRENYDSKHTVVHETVKEISFSASEMDEAIAILTAAKTNPVTADSVLETPEEEEQDEDK